MSHRVLHPTLDDINAAASAWVARRDAGLTDAETREFETWRNADSRHAQAFARFEATWSALGRPRRNGDSSVLASELKTLQRRDRHRRTLMVGGTFAAAALAVMAWWPREVRPALVHSADASPARLLLPERRTLPDGSLVEFPVGAEIAIEFSEHFRRVTLKQGEAHFDISKDPARPFIVSAAGVEVRAVGTSFAVQMQPSAVEVLVTEGRVEVSAETKPRPPGSEHSARRSSDSPVAKTTNSTAQTRSVAIPVDSGNRVVVDRDAESPSASPPPVVKVEPAEIASRLAWRSPRVEFSGAPMAEVIALLNRCNEVKFVIEDPTLATMTLSGLFRAADTDAFVRMLEAGFGVKAHQREQQIFLRRQP